MKMGFARRPETKWKWPKAKKWEMGMKKNDDFLNMKNEI